MYTIIIPSTILQIDDPCVRKRTMPSPPSSGLKRPLTKDDEEETKTATKHLKSILESDNHVTPVKKDQIDDNGQSETNHQENIENNFLAEEEIERTTTKQSLEKDLELSDHENDTVVESEKQKIEEAKIENMVGTQKDEADKVLSQKPKTSQTKKQNCIFKSKEFIDTESDSDPENFTKKSESEKQSKLEQKQKEIILIDPQPLKSIESGIYKQCMHKYSRGAKIGLRCENQTKEEKCGLHKDKPESKKAVPKKELVENIEQTKKESAQMRQEILYMKRQLYLMKKDEKAMTMCKELQEGSKTQEKKIEALKTENEILNKKLLELEKTTHSLKLLKDSQCNLPKKSKTKTILRKKINQLNKSQTYKLKQYCSPSRSEALFESTNGTIKVLLPKLLDRKNKNEGWNLKYSKEENKFCWIKM